MYKRFYGFVEHPFNLTPDPRYLYLTKRHSEALAHLEYALTCRKGVTVLTGEVGTGKTILLRTALARVRSSPLHCAKIWNPTLTRLEFYQFLTAEFGLTPAAAESKARFLIELDAVVKRHHAAGGVTALVVDEAQALSLELLEEIRLLANIESDTEKLLQVVLVGQPELSERLNRPELRQLKQRVAMRCSLGPLELRETGAYIAGRLRIAGGEPAQIFSREAIEEVHQRSQGIPRLIGVICDNALVTGFALGVRPIGRSVILDVCRDFEFEASAVDTPAVEPHQPWTPADEGPAPGIERAAVTELAPSTSRPGSPDSTATRGFKLFSSTSGERGA